MSMSALPEQFIKNPLLHAYLLVSPAAGERTDAARAVAMSMLCGEKIDGARFCGKCPNCVKVLASTHPDLIVFGANGEKSGVSDIRKISAEAYLAPNEADCKVFLLHRADEFNVQSQNALLKILEEPPAGVRFILTASSPAPLLPTVRSRLFTVRVGFGTSRGSAEEILKSRPGISAPLAAKMAAFAECFEGTQPESMDGELFGRVFDSAVSFFGGAAQDEIMVFPKKREELLIYLQVYMLASHELLYCKTTGKNNCRIFDARELNACLARTSAKRAAYLCGLFEDAYLRADSFTNINALIARLVSSV